METIALRRGSSHDDPARGAPVPIRRREPPEQSRQTPVGEAYQALVVLRAELDRARAWVIEVLETQGASRSAEWEARWVDPVFDQVIAQERRVLALRARSMRDLAIKIVVAAENDFACEDLNARLGEEARRLNAG